MTEYTYYFNSVEVTHERADKIIEDWCTPFEKHKQRIIILLFTQLHDTGFLQLDNGKLTCKKNKKQFTEITSKQPIRKV